MNSDNVNLQNYCSNNVFLHNFAQTYYVNDFWAWLGKM